jgi:hypothetical protein
MKAMIVPKYILPKASGKNLRSSISIRHGLKTPTAFSADWKAPTRLSPISPSISRALLA